MTTSVVIPVYNGKLFLQKNLPSVMALKADEVIVIDDASSDDSVQFIKDNYSHVKLIENQKNMRFPKTVNKGFSHANGEIIFLFNQDVKPDKNLIKNTLSHFADDKLFAVTFNEGERSWAKAEIKSGMLNFSNGENDGQIHESFWASGGSAAFRKSIWDKLEGFDTIFSPGYYEDLDLGWRAHKLGYKILWDPKCKVEHEAETSFNKEFSSKKLTQIKERNYLLAIWKNLDSNDYPAHLKSLLIRMVRSPGFVVPVLMALWKKLV